jgi:hypothetical protein
MNVREGMRRLGLVVGVLGASAAVFVSYNYLQTVLTQRARYQAFQALLSSPVVQKEAEFLRNAAANHSLVVGPGSRYQTDATGTICETVECFVTGPATGWMVNKSGVKALYFWASPYDHSPIPDKKKPTVSAADVSEIEKDNGQRVYRTEAPGLRSYLLIPVFPVLGFCLPWGAIKTLTWIGLGFSRSGKPERPMAEE